MSLDKLEQLIAGRVRGAFGDREQFLFDLFRIGQSLEPGEDEFDAEREIERAVGALDGRLNFVQPGQQFPPVFFLAARHVHPASHFGHQHLVNVVGQVFLGEDSVALFVNLGALLVEHVVVLQQVLADVEVETLDSLL